MDELGAAKRALEAVDLLITRLEQQVGMVFPAEDDAPPRLTSHQREFLAASDALGDQLVSPILRRVAELRHEISQLEAARRDGVVTTKQARVRGRALQGEMMRLVADFCRLVMERGEQLLFLLPENPVGVFAPDRAGALPQGRLYLDVTDATLEDVRAVWPFVQYEQQRLARRGKTRKRSPGRQPGTLSPEVQRWVSRAREVGEKAAFREFCTEGDEQAHWEKYQWWYRRVRRHLR